MNSGLEVPGLFVVNFAFFSVLLASGHHGLATEPSPLWPDDPNDGSELIRHVQLENWRVLPRKPPGLDIDRFCRQGLMLAADDANLADSICARVGVAVC
jgi:hypothetical protein